MPKAHITFEEALKKGRQYCAFRERSHKEVELKLKKLGLRYDFISHACMQLSDEGYLSEERFVSSYVRGKFNQNGWGRKKIVQGLKQKGISRHFISEGLLEIDEDAYVTKLKKILEERSIKRAMKYKNRHNLKHDLSQYAQSRGYELDLTLEIVDQIMA